jgi:phage terminase large subunit-like protein
MTSPKRPASPTKPSTPRLSEAARHFVLPKGIVSTGFPSVRATCLKLQIVFDPWQEGAGSAILGKRADGLYAADAIVISIPRQVGKTFLIGAIIFALCIQTKGLLCVWTAHRYVTASETFDSMKAMTQRPEMKPHIVRAVHRLGTA